MKNIADIRKDYAQKELSEAHCLPDPLAQFKVWLDEAIGAQVPEPTAMVVSTVSPEGFPAARVVLLKGVEEGKFVFYTNYHSRKGQHIAATPRVSITFFWPELERQVNIEGTVERTPEAVSDAYFESRPYKSRVGAWASDQSQTVDSKTEIMGKFAMYAAKYLAHVPRPPHWGGYAVTPHRIEFWQGRPSRLHDRILYKLQEGGSWSRERLSP